jgi:basic membrane protein A
MFKKRGLFLKLILIAAILASCQTTRPVKSPSPTPSPAPGAFRIAVVLPSKIDDRSSSQSMYDGLIAFQKAEGKDRVVIDYSENNYINEDAKAALRKYASQNYDLVIAHGVQYAHLIREIAKEFPNLSFAWETNADDLKSSEFPNLFTYSARADQGGYVSGVIAARLTKTGQIGLIGPIETGDAKSFMAGFQAGALATRPGIQVQTRWIGSFLDDLMAANTAQELIANRADVLAGTHPLTVGALRVLKTRNVFWLGNHTDQSDLAPKSVVACQVYHWEVILRQILDYIRQGVHGGRAYTLTMANQGLTVIQNPDFPLPPEVKTAADQATQEIINGSLLP